MTDRITDAIGLQRRINDRSGFLASRQAGRQLYTVHDLGAFCNVPIHLTPGNDSAYYADGASEFTQMRSATDWIGLNAGIVGIYVCDSKRLS